MRRVFSLSEPKHSLGLSLFVVCSEKFTLYYGIVIRTSPMTLPLSRPGTAGVPSRNKRRAPHRQCSTLIIIGATF